MQSASPLDCVAQMQSAWALGCDAVGISIGVDAGSRRYINRMEVAYERKEELREKRMREGTLREMFAGDIGLGGVMAK